MNFLTLLGENSYRLWGNSARLQEEVNGVTADPARAEEGFLFVCTRTALRDGHDSVAAAYGAGCRVFLTQRSVALPTDAAVLTVDDTELLLGELASRFWQYPARGLTVIGITGTAGKTSVALMLMALLKRAGRKVAALTTDGVYVGSAFRPASEVVPDAADIQELLREFGEAGAEIAVLELSAYMLVHKAAFSIPFAAVLLTNLMEAHIGYGEFRDVPSYWAAKQSLLLCGAPITVLPQSLSKIPSVGKQLTFGEAGDFTACDKEPYADRTYLGTRFILRFPNGEKGAVSLPVPGDFAIENALAAAALATVLGLTSDQITAELSVSCPRGRMECVGAYWRRYVFVDSAFDAKSLSRALTILRERTEGRLTVVVGSVGGRARRRRAPLGRAATEYADFAYFTADDPDLEDPLLICADMAQDADPERCYSIADRRAAIERAVLEMRPGDVLLLAGKGGSGFQRINGQRVSFDEGSIVAEAMARF